MAPIGREFQIWAAQSGHVQVVQMRRDSPPSGYLPFHSTRSRADAEQLIVRFCKLNYTGQYVLPAFIDVADLEAAGARFEEEYQRRYVQGPVREAQA